MSDSLQITALMTSPRYECVSARNHIEIALRRLGIPLAVSQGVFYAQCMQAMLGGAVAAGADLIVTIDSDSLFTAEQLHRLIDRMIQDESIDALAPIQVRRDIGTILATANEQEHENNGQLIRANSAHFGCTVLRASVIDRVSKPWFFSKPNADGEWKEGKIDADVWFWEQWKAAGNSLFIDPTVRIGHIEEMVSFVDDRMQVKAIHVADWLARFGGVINLKDEEVAV